MKALAQLGHELALATVGPLQSEAVAGLPLEMCRTLREYDSDQAPSPLTGLAEPLPVLLGNPLWADCSGLADRRTVPATAVVAVGLDISPYLGGVRGPARIWYAGDEWVWHHLSQVRIGDGVLWQNLREAAVKGVYERVFAPLLGTRFGSSRRD